MDDQTKASNDPAGFDPAIPEAGDGSTAGGPKATAESVIEQIREAVDDIAERAAPTVRELSAKAAELTAAAAVKAAPLVKRAGEVTADASEKLAEKSRGWASDLRSGAGAGGTAASGTLPTPAETAAAAEPAPSDLAADESTVTADFDAPAPFETTAEGGDESPASTDER